VLDWCRDKPQENENDELHMPNHAILTRYVKECYTASEDFLKEATILMRGQIVIASARSLVNCD
jgi:hypothetical protein